MSYVYRRANGLFEIRYPIPADVVSYFPKPKGKGVRSHIIKSLGTRDQKEANKAAVERAKEIEAVFSALRDGVASDEFKAFCRIAFEQETAIITDSFLNAEFGKELRVGERLAETRSALNGTDVEQLEAVAGWLVDHFLSTTTNNCATVPKDTPARNAMLMAAASVLSDVYTQGLATVRGMTIPPKPKSPYLLTEPADAPAVGDNIPLTSEGHKSLEQYWEVYETIKQASSSPVQAKTLARRQTAWNEFHQLTGSSLSLFKVQKSHIWAYRDALTKAPARSGSIIELRDLSFPEKLKKADEGNYARLDRGTIADRLRQIQAVFQLAVDRGHLANNPARGVTESSLTSKPHRKAYTTEELQIIFSSEPYDKAWQLEEQNDTFWVPLLGLFMGARASELYLRMEDVFEDDEHPHICVVDYKERSLKNRASERIIPIHPQLVELGFLDYCRRMRAKGDELFPEWEFRKGQKPSESASRRRFNRHLKRLFPDRDFPADTHTFRHTFENALSASVISERIARRLAGRSLGGSVDDYNRLLQLPDLAKAIALISFEGVSLDHLRS